MNKNIISKLKIMSMGLLNRYDENKDIFLSLEGQFVSGLKAYNLIYKKKDNDFYLNFNGESKKLSFQEAFDNIISNCSLYEKLNLSYKERGYEINIFADNKDVKIKNKEHTSGKEENNGHNFVQNTLLNRDYYIKVGEGDKLLKELGIMSQEGKIKNDKIRKYNQIDRYVELLQNIIDSFNGNKVVNILECGCGKSYLSFVLNYYLTEIKRIKCHFTCIDISENVISKSKQMAKNLNYENMEFKIMDIEDYNTTKDIGLLISLHACDTATDMAIAKGIKLNAQSIMVVPCCHSEMQSQYKFDPFNNILKYGILKNKMAAILTDGMRGIMLEAKGYDVSILEYISPLETPKNIMIRALKSKEDNKNMWDEYLELMRVLNVSPKLYNLLCKS